MTEALLDTGRLWLRQFVEDDAAAFHRLNSDPLVVRYTADPESIDSVAAARRILRDHPIADYRRHGYGRWACILKSTDELIGFAGLKYLEDLGEVDLGYRLLPSHWGAGLATEAARASVAHGFERLGLERIIGLVLPENVASVRVLEKSGLHFEATIDYDSLRVDRYAVERSAHRPPEDSR